MLRSVSELCIARGGGQTRDCSNPPRFPPSAPHVPHPPAHGRPAATAAAVQPHTSASPAALGYCVAVQSAGGRWPTLFFSLVKPPLAPCGHTLRMLEGVPARGGSTSRPTLFPPPTPHPPFPLPPLPHRRYQLASFVAGALRAPLPAGWLCRRSTLALFLNGPPLIPPPPPTLTLDVNAVVTPWRAHFCAPPSILSALPLPLCPPAGLSSFLDEAQQQLPSVPPLASPPSPWDSFGRDPHLSVFPLSPHLSFSAHPSPPFSPLCRWKPPVKTPPSR